MNSNDSEEDVAAQLAPAWAVGPAPDAVATARGRMMMALGRAQRRRSVWPILAALAVGCTVGVMAVAWVLPGALPGDFAYPVKRLAEDTRVGVATDSRDEATAWMWVAETRIEEAVRADAAGRDDLLPTLLADYAGAVSSAREQADASTSDEVVHELNRELLTHERVLTGLLATAPAAAVPGLERALQAAHAGQGEHGHGPPASVPPCRDGLD